MIAASEIAIVGATGLVGQEMLRVLGERDYDISRVGLFASRARPEQNILSLEHSAAELKKFQYWLNATEDDVARTLADEMRRVGGSDGPYFIDNSSAFRMNPEVPLVVPEVNGELLGSTPSRIFANPNCTACLLTMALAPLKSYGIERVIVSTYQAASGAGIRGLEELESQSLDSNTRFSIEDRRLRYPVFGFPLMGNVLSHNSRVLDETHPAAGYNGEEWKVMEETRKILNLPDLQVSATCVRVPVRRAHAEAVSVDLKKEISIDAFRALYQDRPGLRVVDQWPENHFPMPIEAEHQDAVLVGRFRQDPFRPQTVHLFLSGDQLRKGAATNAIQIMERLARP